MNQELQSLIDQLIAAGVGLSKDEISEIIEIPPNPAMGEFAFPCFKLAKQMRKAPPLIAKELAENMRIQPPFCRYEAVGPYLNFFLDRKYRIEKVISEALCSEKPYGSSDIGKGKRIIVEFSSTNIAKPFHMGHIRSTVIGNALRNIYDLLGFETIAINHLGDYGTQFGMMIAAYKKWGDADAIRNNPIDEMLKLYVRFNQEAEDRPEYREEARYWFKQLEDKDPEALELWNTFKDLSLVEFNRVYRLLGIEFDSYNGESFYSDKMDAVIQELEEKGLLLESDGARIVDLSEEELPPALIQKSDGSTLYLTRDLAAAIYRKNTYDFDKNLYIVGAPQTLHFQQLFSVLKKMGKEWADDCLHIPFGYICLEDGTLSTRQGKVVYLEDVLNKSIEKTAEIIQSRNPELPDKENVSRQVGIGAVVFQELFNNRIKDYTFVWERTLNFEGETGPYVQYTHARASSILGKAEINEDADLSLLTDNEDAYLLIGAIEAYPEAAIDAMEKNEPYLLTRQILEIAKQFNKLYNTTPILKAEQEERKALLQLVRATQKVIAEGLGVLGIEAPLRM